MPPLLFNNNIMTPLTHHIPSRSDSDGDGKENSRKADENDINCNLRSKAASSSSSSDHADARGSSTSIGDGGGVGTGSVHVYHLGGRIDSEPSIVFDLDGHNQDWTDAEEAKKASASNHSIKHSHSTSKFTVGATHKTTHAKKRPSKALSTSKMARTSRGSGSGLGSQGMGAKKNVHHKSLLGSKH